MLELVRIYRLNVCHRRGDFDPRTRGNHAMAEIAEPKYDTEAASDSVHLVAENRVTRLASRPVSTGSETVQPDLHRSTAAPRPSEAMPGGCVSPIGSANDGTLTLRIGARSPAVGLSKGFQS